MRSHFATSNLKADIILQLIQLKYNELDWFCQGEIFRKIRYWIPDRIIRE